MGDRKWQGLDPNDTSFYGAYTSYDMDKQYSPEMYDYYLSNNVRGAGHVDVSGSFEGLPDGQKVYSFLDPKKRNYAGVYQPQYMYYDEKGVPHVYDSKEALATATG